MDPSSIINYHTYSIISLVFVSYGSYASIFEVYLFVFNPPEVTSPGNLSTRSSSPAVPLHQRFHTRPPALELTSRPLHDHCSTRADPINTTSLSSRRAPVNASNAISFYLLYHLVLSSRPTF